MTASATRGSRGSFRSRLLLAVGTAAGLVALALPAGAAMAKPSVLWTDAAGDAKPPLDLLKGSVSCDRDNINFLINVADLDIKALKGNLTYQIFRVKWTQDGNVRFADAALSHSGDGVVYTSFADGHYYAGTEVLEQHETGTFMEGKNARVTITMPLQNLGLSAGSVLKSVSAESLTYPWYAFYLGVPTPQATGTVVDTAAPGLNVTVGKGLCAATK